MSNAQKAQKYLLAAHAGAVVLLAAVAAAALDAPDFAQGLFAGMLLAIVAILFRSKLRDEYIEKLWNSGTAAALLVTLLVTLGLELVRGFVDETIDVFAAPSLLDATSVGVSALAAFFIGFHFALLRSRA